MTNVITHGGLTVAKDLYDLVNDEILANSAISADRFWSGLDTAVHQLAPKNRELLQNRAKLQKQIDEWLQAHSEGGTYMLTAAISLLKRLMLIQKLQPSPAHSLLCQSLTRVMR